jgi:hypothetical protein
LLRHRRPEPRRELRSDDAGRFELSGLHGPVLVSYFERLSREATPFEIARGQRVTVDLAR